MTPTFSNPPYSTQSNYYQILYKISDRLFKKPWKSAYYTPPPPTLFYLQRGENSSTSIGVRSRPTSGLLNCSTATPSSPQEIDRSMVWHPMLTGHFQLLFFSTGVQSRPVKTQNQSRPRITNGSQSSISKPRSEEAAPLLTVLSKKGHRPHSSINASIHREKTFPNGSSSSSTANYMPAIPLIYGTGNGRRRKR